RRLPARECRNSRERKLLASSQAAGSSVPEFGPRPQPITRWRRMNRMAGKQPVDFETKWGELVARAWSDPAFKAPLLADPAAVLAENGLVMPPDFKVQVVENTDRVIHLTLPPPPSQELSEEELQRTAGGKCGGCRATLDGPRPF